MVVYDFRMVLYIYVGCGVIVQLSCVCVLFIGNVRCIFLVIDVGVWKLGLIDVVVKSFEVVELDVYIFDQVVVDLFKDVVLMVEDQVWVFGVEIVIGLGGGSLMDIVKLIVLFLGLDQVLEDMYGVNNVIGLCLLFVFIFSIVGIGFEVMLILVIIIGESMKMGVNVLFFYVDIVVLDVELILGLLCVVIVVIGIDVMVYVIEGYMFRIEKNLIFDSFVLVGLRKLYGVIECVCLVGDDVQV